MVNRRRVGSVTKPKRSTFKMEIDLEMVSGREELANLIVSMASEVRSMTGWVGAKASEPWTLSSLERLSGNREIGKWDLKFANEEMKKKFE